MNGALLNSAFSATGLTIEQVRSIIMSGTNISSTEADAIVKQVEETYGKSKKGILRVKGILTGSRWNYGIFKDRKIWHFNASFIPEGQDEPVYVPALIEAEFFNGGLKINLISRDWVFIFLPDRMTIENLEDFDTGRGFSFNTVSIINTVIGLASGLPIQLPIELSGGIIDTHYGPLYLVTTSVGLKSTGITFPRLKMKVNPDVYHNYNMRFLQ